MWCSDGSVKWRHSIFLAILKPENPVKMSVPQPWTVLPLISGLFAEFTLKSNRDLFHPDHFCLALSPNTFQHLKDVSLEQLGPMSYAKSFILLMDQIYQNSFKDHSELFGDNRFVTVIRYFLDELTSKKCPDSLRTSEYMQARHRCAYIALGTLLCLQTFGNHILKTVESNSSGFEDSQCIVTTVGNAVPIY